MPFMPPFRPPMPIKLNIPPRPNVMVMPPAHITGRRPQPNMGVNVTNVGPMGRGGYTVFKGIDVHGIASGRMPVVTRPAIGGHSPMVPQKAAVPPSAHPPFLPIPSNVLSNMPHPHPPQPLPHAPVPQQHSTPPYHPSAPAHHVPSIVTPPHVFVPPIRAHHFAQTPNPGSFGNWHFTWPWHRDKRDKGVQQLGAGLFWHQDPEPTEFERKLQAGQPFQMKIHPKPDIDPRNAVWLGDLPTDQQMKQMRFEDPNDPSKRVWTDTGQEANLNVDNSAVMPIRDPKTHELKGYRYRQGDTMWVLDRNGGVQDSRNLEKPLEKPAVDPTDVAMVVFFDGVPAVKGVLQAGGSAARAAAADEGPTIARFGEDEIKELSEMWRKKLAAETDPDRAQAIGRYLSALQNKTRIRDWKQSEDEMSHIYSLIGGKGETTFEVEGAGGARQITKPDIDAPNVRGEVKNWEMIHIRSERTAENMLDTLAGQVQARRNIMPFKDQTVILDLRGQKLTEDQIQTIGRTFSERTGLPLKNIQIVTWSK